MRSTESDAALAAALAREGVGLRADREHGTLGDGRDALTAWRAFRALALEPADDLAGEHGDDDLLIYETGVGSFRRAWDDPDPIPVYTLMLRRQFSYVDDDGEYGGMAALGLGIDFERAPELLATRDEQLWGQGGPPPPRPSPVHPEIELWQPDAGSWADAVEASPAFTLGFGGELVARGFAFSYFGY